MKNRKGFNFYKSYYEVALQLENEKDRLDYLMAILDKQFKDIEPKLTGIANFAYVSQKHSIDAQVEGYKNKIGYKPSTEGSSLPPSYVSGDSVMTTEGPTQPPYLQEKEKEKEKGKVQAELEEKEKEEELNKIFRKLNIPVETKH